MADQTADTPSGRTPATGLALVVVGYDTSRHSEIAVRWAAEIARQTSATLRVIWAWRRADVWEEALHGEPFTGVPPMTELEELAQRRLRADVAALVGGSGANVEYATVCSDPEDVLIAAAIDADMLFVGSRGRGRGRGWFGSGLLGSVSERCVRDATCPVVVIPPHMAGA